MIEKISKTLESYEEREKERRISFFKTIGIEDDGRRNPLLTREEFMDFCKDRKCVCDPYSKCKSEDTVIIYFEFAAYTDDTYYYDKETDTVYRDSYSIGD